MARVTVEDCVTVVNNRYELVLLAAQRARDIAAGMQLTVDRDNDKNAVVALREIAQQSIDLEELKRHIVRGVNRHSDLTSEDDALMALTQETLANVQQQNEEVAPGTQITEINFEDNSSETPAQEVAEEEAATDGPSNEEIAEAFAEIEADTADEDEALSA